MEDKIEKELTEEQFVKDLPREILFNFFAEYKTAESADGRDDAIETGVKRIDKHFISKEEVRECIEETMENNQRHIDAYHYSDLEQKPYKQSNKALEDLKKKLGL